MPSINDLKVKLFMDGADIDSMRDAIANNPLVKGFTTNPTLMRAAGVTDYSAFAHQALAASNGLPISFEVFSDDFPAMEREANIIASWGENAFVKVPITNTQRESSCPLIEKLARQGVKLNVTAIFSLEQVKQVAKALNPEVPAVVSVFAGRIADTGLDPMPIMEQCLEIIKPLPMAELLWASPREMLNIIQADQVGCHIITATPGIIAKLANFGKDLEDFSLETVQMFYRDAQAAKYAI